MSGRAPDAALGRRLGHDFADPSLLALALTHPSAAYERDGSRGNERLEFLGDAVLDLVVAEALHAAHPDWSEGQLSRTRAVLVNARSLSERARQVGLGPYLQLGRTEVQSQGHEKDSILANCLEAVVAALYLDGGLSAAAAFVRGVFPEAWDPSLRPPERDAKTRLNEWALDRRGVPPRYVNRADRGEGAGDRRFEVEVRIDGEPVGGGRGATRKQAERAAAAQALERLEADPAEPVTAAPSEGGSG